MPDQDIASIIKEAIHAEMEASGWDESTRLTLIEMAKNYQAVIKIGKWIGAFALFVSVTLGIAVAIKDLFLGSKK